MLAAVALSSATLLPPSVSTAAAQSKPSSATADRSAVRQAVLDYVEGVYQAQPERIHKSV